MFQYADLIVDHFQTEHHKIKVDSARVLPSLEQCIKAMSEPMISHDCIGYYLLSEEVSKHVKVVQTGQGADEIFAGYHWYPPLMESANPVKRVDNMTMAWGLEARVPFLDHELVEFAARIPAEYNVPHGGKHILKEVAVDYIPADVIDRPKGFFALPVLTYFRGEYFDFVYEVLNAPVVKDRGIFNRGYVDAILKEPDAHITPQRGSKLWQMALLEYWLAVHNV